MEEKPKYSKAKPGLEEALHPDIGNGASWEDNPHAYLLRHIDPSKALESRLLDHVTKDEILQRWKTPSDPTAEDIVDNRPMEESDLVPEPTETTPIEVSEHISDQPINIPALTDSESIENTILPQVIREEKGKAKKQAAKASKRIRKVADQARREEEALVHEKESNTPGLTESSLSPFTRWVKGLLGSEYVHPYGDDFAIDQGEHVLGEGISETFADLLAAQGYKDQAIGMYQKLIEKFPEKSRFFAAKIEALQ